MPALAFLVVPACTEGGDLASPVEATTSPAATGASLGGAPSVPSAESSSRAAPSPALPLSSGLRPLPLTPIFEEVASDDPSVFRAIELQVQACMTDKGFEYIPVEPFTGQVIDPNEGVATMMEDLVDDGSDDPDEGGDEAVRRTNSAWEALPTEQREAWERAYDGTVVGQLAREGAETVELPEGGSMELPGGCLGQAQEALRTDRGVAAARVDEFVLLYNETRERVKAHPTVQQVTEEWSQCLARRGFEYADPHDALEADEGRGEDLRVAMSDCAAEVDWALRVNPVEVAVHEQVIAENEGLIASLADQREAARQRARELLGEG